ncbi:MAG: sigma 54-interacting transcriptional regulator [Candidatus Latescibacteria bacterium]|nr:sigma 54-interacting transcriptional regulator [Candidatus Latescibacterota bacterium]
MAESPDTVQGLGIWEHFTMRDGLPDMKVECVFEDSRGMLWIGTHDRGIVRYDGDEFQAFGRHDGLPGDGVFSILEDRRGTMWFGTNQGIGRFDGRVFESVELGQACSLLWGSCMDPQGSLWFGVERRPGHPPAVCRWEGAGLELLEVAEVATPAGQSIHQIVVDGQGVLWLGGDGLFRHLGGGRFEAFRGVPEAVFPVLDLLPLAGGGVWIASDTGVWCTREGKLEQVLAEASSYGPVGLVEDPAGVVWLTTYDGRLFRHHGGEFQLVARLNAILRGGLCVDRAGRLWIGTYGMGVYCFDATRTRIFRQAQGLPGDKVACLEVGPGGTLWVGTDRGLVTYRGDQFLPFDGVDRRDLAVSLFLDRKERLWVGTRNGRLYGIDKGEMTQYLNSSLMGGYRVSSIAADHQGRIWFGCRYGKGFGYWEEGRIVHHPSEKAAAGRYPAWVGALEVDSQGGIWIGSSAPAMWDGLCRYDQAGFSRVAGVSGSAVLSLHQDRAGRMWIGTNEGLICCEGGNFVRFTQKDGLPCELVTALLQDTAGVLWIGTEGGGIGCYDGQVFQVIQFPGEPACNVVHAIRQDQRGRLWFATEGGLVQYAPRRVPPVVQLSRVVADRTYEGPAEVQFPLTTTRISFCFRGVSPLEPSAYLVYRYRLQGYDKGWHQTRERQVDYPQLRPGEYEFAVQAVDRDLNYSPAAQVRVVVTEDPHIEALNEALRAEAARGNFIGESGALREIKKQLQEVAATELTVLILGETGTGKGLAAQVLHGFSARHDGPFIHVNCGALQEGLVDSELFGHEKGSFTGAISRKMGKFELANGGTIFLDEIGDLPLEAQTRLLRVLQEHCIERVGGTQTIPIDVRVIAATNRDLEAARRAETFRPDLYYRLNVFPVRLPPLRERKEDIPQLSRTFVTRFAAHLNQKNPPLVSEESMGLLLAYDWPGNVRELEHTLQRAVILANLGGRTVILPEHLGMGPVSQGDESRTSGPAPDFAILPLEEYERRYLIRVLDFTAGVIHGPQGAASLLKMKPTTLRSRLEKLGIKRRKSEGDADEGQEGDRDIS